MALFYSQQVGCFVVFEHSYYCFVISHI